MSDGNQGGIQPRDCTGFGVKLGSQSADQDLDQEGPWPGTGMAVAELETGTPTA